MQIDLSTLEDELGFDEELRLEAARVDPERAETAFAVRLSGRVRRAGDGYHLAGTLRATGSLICSRCLEPTPWQAEESFTVDFRTPAVADLDLELVDGELDVAFLDGELIDLEQVAVEQLVLALPMRVLCNESCAGLCPSCGANRNLAEACGCLPDVDPRWQALRDLTGRDSPN